MSEKKEENPMERINKLEQIIAEQQRQIKALNDELVAVNKAQKELLDLIRTLIPIPQVQTQQSSTQVNPELLSALQKQSQGDPTFALMLFKSLFGEGGSEKTAMKIFEIYRAGMRDTFRLFSLLGKSKREELFKYLFGEEEEEEKEK
jgi:uncharacterized coiled-coil protein SlyX